MWSEDSCNKTILIAMTSRSFGGGEFNILWKMRIDLKKCRILTSVAKWQFVMSKYLAAAVALSRLQRSIACLPTGFTFPTSA
jgi:hypothetical protein